MPQVPPFYCSSSACTPLYFKGEQVLSLLTWVQILRACSIVLLVMGLIVLLISWLGHLPWLIRLGSVLSLAASAFAWIAAAHIQDTFDDVLPLEQTLGGRLPGLSSYYHFEREIAAALQGAFLLCWLVIVVTLVLLLASALGLWRGFRVRDRAGIGQRPTRRLSPPPTNEYGVAR